MKSVFTIAPEESFLDCLADGLWQRAEGNASRLADGLVLLPTRRACRLLRECFLKKTDGGALLLPRLQPIGDFDEDEWLFADSAIDSAIAPAINPLRRRLLLARLINSRDPGMPIDQAAHLAEALARFLDEAQIRNCDFSCLPGLVQQRELAQHWQETVQFLSLLTKAWPQVLAEEGCLDPAERRNRVIAAQIAMWQTNLPSFPIVAAGSTGSMPATAAMLDAIAGLPLGCVILPGLDQGLNEETWQEVDEQHPQHGMKALLDLMGVKRSDVKNWSAPTVRSPRTHLFSEALRPASTSDAWRHLRPDSIAPSACTGLSRATFAHTQEEAQAIALMLRQALDDPQQTIALVTPDRNLAERVVTLLARWDITANDSSGTSLVEQPAGSFWSAVITAAAPDAGAVAWLSLLKHPLAACGLSLAECRANIRAVEISFWRTEQPEISPWFDQIKKDMAGLTANWRVEQPFSIWLDIHTRVAEQYASSDQETGAARLWSSEAGETTATWLADLRAAAADFPPLNGETYRNLLGELLRQASFRPSYGQHPRLSILGPLEARLLRPDFVVLGGMNEGVWPPEIAIDPWMSRPMKKDFGMAAAEYRIGLSAHDFVQLASAPRVIITRALRSGGAPTVPSRFLLQLETVLQALSHSNAAHDALATAEPWRDWVQLLDEPPVDEIKPCTPPEPKPPVDLRPTSLSVTEIGTWQRNPYAIYAKHVLGLRKIDPLEAELDAADHGNLIHQALEKFIRAFPDQLPVDALEQLLSIGRELFKNYAAKADVQAFWWPRYEKITAWFVEHERERREVGIRPLATEVAGRMALDEFILKGRADRIDRLADGSLSIIDYKTGGVPTKKVVESGLEPQLPLLALMAARGSFDAVPTATAGELAYWKLGGGPGEKSNQETSMMENLDVLANEAEQGLRQLVKTFTDPATAYQAVPKPSRAPRYDDYAHLARLSEWGRTSEES